MSTYRIADLIVEMSPAGMTRKLAQPYWTDSPEAPDIVIRTDRRTLKDRYPAVSESYAEYLDTGAEFYTGLADFYGMMLHASCVVVDGKAYLFTAPCGTGKSTHTGLWLKLFGDAAYILNDDKPAIRCIDNKLYVYGTPWSGKHGLNRNEKVPLQGICVLHRAEVNEIHSMEASKTVYELLSQTPRRLGSEAMQKLLDMLQRLITLGCVYELGCNMDISAAKIAYEYMSGKKVNDYED